MAKLTNAIKPNIITLTPRTFRHRDMAIKFNPLRLST